MDDRDVTVPHCQVKRSLLVLRKEEVSQCEAKNGIQVLRAAQQMCLIVLPINLCWKSVILSPRLCSHTWFPKSGLALYSKRSWTRDVSPRSETGWRALHLVYKSIGVRFSYWLTTSPKNIQITTEGLVTSQILMEGVINSKALGQFPTVPWGCWGHSQPPVGPGHKLPDHWLQPGTELSHYPAAQTIHPENVVMLNKHKHSLS